MYSAHVVLSQGGLRSIRPIMQQQPHHLHPPSLFLIFKESLIGDSQNLPVPSQPTPPEAAHCQIARAEAKDSPPEHTSAGRAATDRISF